MRGGRMPLPIARYSYNVVAGSNDLVDEEMMERIPAPGVVRLTPVH